MSYLGVFTVESAAMFQLRLLVLGYKITNRDEALTPTLDALLAWLGQPVMAARTSGALSDVALASLLEGVAFPDDAALEAVRVAYLAYLRRVKPDPPPPPPPPPPEDPPLEDANLLLGNRQPWVAGSLTQISPAWVRALVAFCRAHPDRYLILADMDALPAAMRRAGFSGRDNALYYTLSRSFARWPWNPSPGDPDNHLSGQRDQLHDFWANYLNAVTAAMQAVPATRALFLKGDKHDACGDVLSEYSLRDMQPVVSRIERGDVYHG